MQEHGDMILKVFHKHNFTYCANMDWQTLLQKIEEQNDEESRKLLKQLNDQLLRKIVEVYNELQSDPQLIKEKYFSKYSLQSATEEIHVDTIKVTHKCSLCETQTLPQKPVMQPSALKGILNKIFGNSNQMFDQRED